MDILSCIYGGTLSVHGKRLDEAPDIKSFYATSEHMMGFIPIMDHAEFYLVKVLITDENPDSGRVSSVPNQ